MKTDNVVYHLRDGMLRYGLRILAANLLAFFALRAAASALRGEEGSARWIAVNFLLLASTVFAVIFFAVSLYSFLVAILQYRHQQAERRLSHDYLIGGALIDPQGDRDRTGTMPSEGLNPARKWTVGPR
jgi:hypothetical protein